MSDDRFDRLEDKMDVIITALSEHKVVVEKRITRLETIQKGFITLLGKNEWRLYDTFNCNTSTQERVLQYMSY